MNEETKKIIEALETIKNYCEENYKENNGCFGCALYVTGDCKIERSGEPRYWDIKEHVIITLD